MSEAEYIVEARGLHKFFGPPQARVHALRGSDLQLRRGEFLAIMGPSGCGKSTLLHVVGLMTRPDEGALVIDGRDVTVANEAARAEIRRRTIGFVFQRFNLLGTLSGIDNIRLSLRIRGVPEDGSVGPLLESMGVSDAARRKPGQMSIGQQQRLAVARAVAHRPDMLLADEPTGSLDSANADALLELLTHENRQRGQTIVMITHSPAVASAAQRILYMKDGIIERQA